ncbi:MAG: hypothetical protein V4479_03220 [Actinomycetota bacterium]
MLQEVVRAAEETQHALIWPNWVFPLIAAVVFGFLAFVMHSFRDVANRHSDKTDGQSSGGHGAGH